MFEVTYLGLKNNIFGSYTVFLPKKDLSSFIDEVCNTNGTITRIIKIEVD